MKKVTIDWTLTANDIGVATDITWMRHIREKARCTIPEAEAEFRRAVNTRILRCDSDACQLFNVRHGVSVYVFHKNTKP